LILSYQLSRRSLSKNSYENSVCNHIHLVKLRPEQPANQKGPCSSQRTNVVIAIQDTVSFDFDCFPVDPRAGLVGNGSMMNSCPKCGKPIRIPQDEVEIIRTKVGGSKTVDRMAHKVCPVDLSATSQTGGPVGGQEYCSRCGHNKTLHGPKCGYASFDYRCDCKEYRS
jgi:hypothetical protein